MEVLNHAPMAFETHSRPVRACGEEILADSAEQGIRLQRDSTLVNSLPSSDTEAVPSVKLIREPPRL